MRNFLPLVPEEDRETVTLVPNIVEARVATIVEILKFNESFAAFALRFALRDRAFRAP